MKQLLALLLLILPLASTAAAYRWVDENGNVRFGSKPPAEQPAVNKKATPKPAEEKAGGNTTGIKIVPRREPPAITPTPAPRALPAQKPATAAQSPRPEKPVTANRTKTESADTATPSTPPPTASSKPKPSSTPAPKPKKPPASKPAKSTPKAVRKPTPKKKETVPKAAQETNKKADQPAVKKPAKKEPAERKVITKEKSAAKPAVATTEPGTDQKEENSIDKNAELCGMFTTFVSDYENKLIGCQGSSCIIYKRSLAKYQKKKLSYCR